MLTKLDLQGDSCANILWICASNGLILQRAAVDMARADSASAAVTDIDAKETIFFLHLVLMLLSSVILTFEGQLELFCLLSLTTLHAPGVE